MGGWPDCQMLSRAALPVQALNAADKVFGSTVNSKGFKVIKVGLGWVGSLIPTACTF